MCVSLLLDFYLDHLSLLVLLKLTSIPTSSFSVGFNPRNFGWLICKIKGIKLLGFLRESLLTIYCTANRNMQCSSEFQPQVSYWPDLLSIEFLLAILGFHVLRSSRHPHLHFLLCGSRYHKSHAMAGGLSSCMFRFLGKGSHH